MASAQVSELLCKPCRRDGKEIKAIKRCFKCHELLCKTCSISHQTHELTANHKLLQLAQFTMKSTFLHDPSPAKQTSPSINKEELSSDFLENVSLTKSSVLYRRAQVAKQYTTSKQEKRTTLQEADPTQLQLKATRSVEFSSKTPEHKSKVFVMGIQCVSDKVVIVDDGNKMLKLFDHSGTYLSSTKLKDTTWGITYVLDSTFATCGESCTVNLWKVLGLTIVNEDVYQVKHGAHGIDYNGTYYCVLHRTRKAITLLDRQGRQVGKIDMKEAFWGKFKFEPDIHMDSDTNNIFVLCSDEDGVLCMSKEGKRLWFTPLSLTVLSFTLQSSPPLGITEMQGTLCVAGNGRLHLITKNGEYVRKLLDKEDLGGRPKCVCYGQHDKLYVSYYSGEKISVYTVTQ